MISLGGVTSLPPAESMTLRFPSYCQQLLFTGAGVLGLAVAALGQQDADVVIAGQVQRLKVVGVTGASLMVRGEFGDRPIPLAQITEVRMAAPPEWAQGLQAYQAKDYPKALPLVRGVAYQFRGLPTTWAQQASALLVELYVLTGEPSKAEAEYAAFLRAYPTGATTQSEVLAARIAVGRKNFAVAKQKLAPITDAALKEKTLNPANAAAYSQAFLVSGQVKEAEGNFPGALEDYLRTVTIFYHDRAAVTQAQERADALRTQHPDVTVP